MKKSDSYTGHNFKLLILLALIPIVFTAIVYFFGSYFFDGATYREDDAAMSNVKEDNYVIPREKTDITIHQSGKSSLADIDGDVKSDSVRN